MLTCYKLESAVAPVPSIADGLYLLGYAALAAGLVTLVRSRTTGPDRASLIDALIIAIGVGVLAWAFWVSQYAQDPALPLGQKLAWVAYPLMDVALIAAVIRLALGPGERAPSYYLLALSLLLLLGADIIYGQSSLTGGGSVDLGQRLCPPPAMRSRTRCGGPRRCTRRCGRSARLRRYEP